MYVNLTHCPDLRFLEYFVLSSVKEVFVTDVLSIKDLADLTQSRCQLMWVLYWKCVVSCILQNFMYIQWSISLFVNYLLVWSVSFPRSFGCFLFYDLERLRFIACQCVVVQISLQTSILISYLSWSCVLMAVISGLCPGINLRNE